MRVIVQRNKKEAAEMVTKILADKILFNPTIVLGLATGNTMVPVYRKLVQLYKKRKISLAKTTVFMLDDYIGWGVGDPNSYHTYMVKHLISQTNLPLTKFHIPNGKAENPFLECQRYEKVIKDAGGIELQILGLGQNGHIGFNEPGSAFESRTRVVTLDILTREVNSKILHTLVPSQAITMGLGTIMESKEIILLITDPKKACTLSKILSVRGPTLDIPATILYLHPKVSLVVDEDMKSV